MYLYEYLNFPPEMIIHHTTIPELLVCIKVSLSTQFSRALVASFWTTPFRCLILFRPLAGLYYIRQLVSLSISQWPSLLSTNPYKANQNNAKRDLHVDITLMEEKVAFYFCRCLASQRSCMLMAPNLPMLTVGEVEPKRPKQPEKAIVQPRKLSGSERRLEHNRCESRKDGLTWRKAASYGLYFSGRRHHCHH